MSWSTVIRDYIDEKPQTVEEKISQGSWLRKLIAPAALGLSLGFGMLQLVACGGEQPIGDESFESEGDGKEDSLGKGKKCTTNKQCGPGMFCKKAAAPVITPKYGVQPPPAITPKYGVTPPVISPKYGVMPPVNKTGVCKPLAECHDTADCAVGQRCVGAEAAPTVGKCPEGAYCILPPLPQPGICMNECETDKDCANGESCTKEASSGCPEGAYCILPPTPKKGVCETKIYPILPPASK